MLKRLRGALMLAASVLLVLALGVVAAWGHLTTAHRVDQAERADRLHLQQTLAGLTDQYLRFTFLDTSRSAASLPWRLRRGDPQDVALLQRVATHSPLASFGAALVSTTGAVLSSYGPQGLPEQGDPGFGPLRLALLRGEPGLSDVMPAGRSHVVAFAVPVVRGELPVALLVAFADVRSWPLQGYDRSLQLGRRALPYVVDRRGVVAASGDESAVGRPLPSLPAVVTAGGSGEVTLGSGRGARLVSYASAGQGWTAITVQQLSTFDGGLAARNRHDTVVVLLLVAVVVLLLVGFDAARQRALRRLADERLLDPLTGLAQRRLFEFRVEASLARQRRHPAPMAVIYCDLDGFKAVNDTYGHNVGDQLLVAVADRMRQVVREDDLVARLGGDEFAVVVEHADVDEVAAVVSRLVDVVQRPLLLAGEAMRPSLSVGAAVLRDPARAEDLLVEADLAMYRVKRGVPGSPLVVLDATTVPPIPEQAPAPEPLGSSHHHG